ncbi:MAG: hypothetical protein ACXAE3_05535 [Candidatus Kariarchaeaceae archaeon]|jgi:hypothetical protein
MENLTLFRGAVFITFAFLLAALVTPIATIAIDLTISSNALEVLEFVCVWCQYGATDNNPNGTAMILNITSIDFFMMWIPILGLFALSAIPLTKAFPNSKWGQRFSDSFAINMLWVIAGLSMAIRGLLTLLIIRMENDYKSLFPDNFVKGELGWGAALLIFAAIASASAAMFGFIEFQYELEETPASNNSAQ